MQKHTLTQTCNSTHKKKTLRPSLKTKPFYYFFEMTQSDNCMQEQPSGTKSRVFVFFCGQVCARAKVHKPRITQKKQQSSDKAGEELKSVSFINSSAVIERGMALQLLMKTDDLSSPEKMLHTCCIHACCMHVCSMYACM